MRLSDSASLAPCNPRFYYEYTERSHSEFALQFQELNAPRCYGPMNVPENVYRDTNDRLSIDAGLARDFTRKELN